MIVSNSMQDPNPELQAKLLRIYALWEGLQNLALNYVALEGEKGRQDDAINEIIQELQRIYEEISAKAGGGCYPGWYNCNGVCSIRPCWIIGLALSDGSLAARLLRASHLLEAILNACLNLVAYEETLEKKIEKANLVIRLLEGEIDEMQETRADPIFYAAWFDCNGVPSRRPC
jgi:hypothetical protein